MAELRIAALGIERRTIAIAIFRQLHLEDVLVHHLPANTDKALQAVVEFLHRIIERYSVSYLALNKPSNRASDRHAILYAESLKIARAKGVPCTEIEMCDLLNAYGHPPVRQRQQLRQVGFAIWPVLNSQSAPRSCVDAAILGLHVQVERLFQFYGVRS